MGVYSTVAAEQLKENQMLQNFHYSDLLEFAVNTEVANQRMFNAMIELDFHEAVEKLNGSYLTEGNDEAAEAKKESIIVKIGKKIIDALVKFGQMIKTAIDKFIIHCQEFFKANKALVKKIGTLDSKSLNDAAEATKTFDSREFKKFKGNYDVLTDPCNKITNFKKKFNQGLSGAQYRNEDVGEFVKNQVQEVRQIGSDINVDDLFETQPLRKYINDNDYVSSLKSNLEGGFKKIVDTFVKDVAEAKKENDSSISKVKEQLKKAKGGDNNTLTASLNADYAIFNAMNAQYAKLLRTGITVAVAKMKNDRYAYAVLGKMVAKYKNSVKTESTVESTFIECATIEMLNEEFVDSIFA